MLVVYKVIVCNVKKKKKENFGLFCLICFVLKFFVKIWLCKWYKLTILCYRIIDYKVYRLLCDKIRKYIIDLMF